MVTTRERLTRPFVILEIVGLSAGVVLSFLGWKEVKTIQYIGEVAWPVADAARATNRSWLAVPARRL